MDCLQEHSVEGPTVLSYIQKAKIKVTYVHTPTYICTYILYRVH